MKLLVALLAALPLLAASPKVEDLAWMSGHWTLTKDGVVMEEIWSEPRGGMLIGMHRDAKEAKASYEFFRIATTPEGIVYFAQPGGRPPTPFALVESGEQRAVFANPQHDFPKRLSYWREDAKLCARVEGDGEAAEQWCWSRK